jgi:pimeloyl-ACP methyl ester carboxylesterase
MPGPTPFPARRAARSRHHPRYALLAALLCACASGPGGGAAFDPLAADPPDDRAHPARLAEGTAFTSAGARMNAVFYEAAGAGPHPTAVVLHGFPGNERNLDVAHALRRAGWNAVFFHYRGSWGSQGSFSFGHVLEDVAAVLDTLRDPAFAAERRVDPARIALIGHSMGGFAALWVGSERADVGCVASLAGANLGLLGASLGDAAYAERVGASFEQSGGGAIAGLSGEALTRELRENAARFDLVRRAPQLAQKPVLLVAGLRDGVARPELHHGPLVAAIAAQPGARVEHVELDADHAFSGSRVALTRAVLEFLARQCAAVPH